MFIDTHAHLNDPRYDADREAVIQRAAEQGVTQILCIGIDVATSRQALELAEAYEGVYATVGLHPHDAKTADADTFAALRRLADHPKVVAIGEIGLDAYRDLSPRETQEEIFRSLIQLAHEKELPLVIHNRDAHGNVLRILDEEEGWARGGVMHCFSGTPGQAQIYLDQGFYLGLDGPVTFPNARELQELAAQLPLEQILVETDCPYLTPHPHRGQRNEPGYVRLVAEKIAELQGRSLEEVARVTTANAERLFKIAQGTGPEARRSDPRLKPAG